MAAQTTKITFLSHCQYFGVKYTNQQDAEHLQTILTQYYKVSSNWTGQKYVGLT